MDFEFAPTSTWLPTAAIGAAGLVLGIGIASAAYSIVESKHAQQSRATISSLRSQITTLQATISAQTTALSTPLESDSPQPQIPNPKVREAPVDKPAPAQEAASAPVTPQVVAKPAPVAAIPQAQPKVAPAKPQVVTPKTPPTLPTPPQKPADTKPSATPAPPAVETPQKSDSKLVLPLPTTPSPAAAKAPEQPAAPPPPQAVSSDEIKQAEKSNPIEMAPPGKVGVAKIEGDVVVMKSGTRVRTGDKFTSGERLLMVDQEAGKIITNRRTVVLMN